MSDLISKEAAVAVASGYCHPANIAKELAKLPEAIVRCRDCENYDLAPNGVNGSCNRQYATFYSWDFCSYGERRTNEI